jgi:hypothetical protein
MRLSESTQVCQAGHEHHQSKIVSVILDGQPAVPDLPEIPHEWACTWDMHVWDIDLYMGQTGIYCTGQDETSLSIASQGIWEGFETLAALEILQTPGLVVDVGAQVGWYTMLAAVNGCDVIAVEADPENVRLLEKNTAQFEHVEIVHGWVGETTGPAYPEPTRLLKVDIEGLEREAVRVFWPALVLHDIDWVMLELTPSFPRSDTGGIVARLHAADYETRLVPTKGEPVGRSVWDASTPITPGEAVTLTEQRTLLAGRP